jgi:hypothetical protein
MNQMFSIDTPLGEYESVIRKEIGNELDGFKKSIVDLENHCTVRLMNVDMMTKGSPITIESLLYSPEPLRCKVLSAFLYNDALWRLEAAHLMMCAGMLSVAFTNLRTCIEFYQTAFIVERCDEEAKKFLENKEVNLKLLDSFLINKEYSTHLQELKDLYSRLGVHRHISSLQLSNLFCANRFDKFVAESLHKHRPFQLSPGFVDAAKMCISHGNRVWLLFS